MEYLAKAPPSKIHFVHLYQFHSCILMITIVVGMGGVPSVQYRDPDLGEVIEFLSNPCSVIQVSILDLYRSLQWMYERK